MSSTVQGGAQVAGSVEFERWGSPPHHGFAVAICVAVLASVGLRGAG